MSLTVADTPRPSEPVRSNNTPRLPRLDANVRATIASRGSRSPRALASELPSTAAIGDLDDGRSVTALMKQLNSNNGSSGSNGASMRPVGRRRPLRKPGASPETPSGYSHTTSRNGNATAPSGGLGTSPPMRSADRTLLASGTLAYTLLTGQAAAKASKRVNCATARSHSQSQLQSQRVGKRTTASTTASTAPVRELDTLAAQVALGAAHHQPIAHVGVAALTDGSATLNVVPIQRRMHRQHEADVAERTRRAPVAAGLGLPQKSLRVRADGKIVIQHSAHPDVELELPDSLVQALGGHSAVASIGPAASASASASAISGTDTNIVIGTATGAVTGSISGAVESGEGPVNAEEGYRDQGAAAQSETAAGRSAPIAGEDAGPEAGETVVPTGSQREVQDEAASPESKEQAVTDGVRANRHAPHYPVILASNVVRKQVETLTRKGREWYWHYSMARKERGMSKLE